ncbi:hypothetical protein J421_4863 (plasmid) [Gemmatirosa kalamazoonensis]|uniref:Uncharacterized protein n=1 Tax=Gemmatirosa kalamazoonensis TaxID=861299 RepID=W0RS30_9BACT|nr:hypothetical protein [Gemmatirosa kalamazoonensis]AHG92398.1 hypothetical protein J421_4863 [Gemmatirosa kalamazoonensis]
MNASVRPSGEMHDVVRGPANGLPDAAPALPNAARAPRPPGGRHAIHAVSVSRPVSAGPPGRPPPPKRPPCDTSGDAAAPMRTHAKSASAHRQREPFASTSTAASPFTSANSPNGSVDAVYAVLGPAARVSASARRAWSNAARFSPVVASTTTNALPPRTDLRYQNRVGEIHVGGCATSTVRFAKRSPTAAARR